MRKIFSLILVILIACFLLAGCSTSVNIEGTWIFDGWYVADNASEEWKTLYTELGISDLNDGFQSGTIKQTVTFKDGVQTITTSGLGNSKTVEYTYSLNGNKLTLSDGTYDIKLEGDTLSLTKDEVVEKYHR